MDGQRRFAVIGTDPRLAAAGRALARAGFAVGGPEQTALADYILLPLPLDESRTPLAELLRAARPGALALGGKLSAQARQIAAEAGVELVDYFAREELILCNAIPTADADALEQRHPAGRFWAGGAGAWGAAGGTGRTGDGGRAAAGPAGTGGEFQPAGGGSGPAGTGCSGL